MTEPDHATIQLLAAKGYLVLFLENTLPSHHRRWRARHLKLIDRSISWRGTDQGYNFWYRLCIESKQFYND